MPAPQEIVELIERFERNRSAYRSGEYNEAGYAEAYKDVVYELYGLTEEEIKIVEERR